MSSPSAPDSPTIVKSNPEDQPIVLLSASSTKRDLHALTEFLELNVVDQLKILPGVGEVSLAGYEQRNLRVWVDNNKLKPLQLTILDVKNALASEQIEEAAGYLENSQNEFNVRTMGEGATPEQVGNIQIKKRGGEEIYNSNHPHQGHSHASRTASTTSATSPWSTAIPESASASRSSTARTRWPWPRR